MLTLKLTNSSHTLADQDLWMTFTGFDEENGVNIIAEAKKAAKKLVTDVR